MSDDIVNRLRMAWESMGEMANAERAEAADEIEQLREELDAARSECCRCWAEAEGGTPEEHAQDMGWDCFKETL